jgi:O-antigen/teichoic acid export membrane protein
MALVLALPLPLVGAGGAAQGMLTRRRGYRALAGRTIIGQGLGALIGIVLAAAGAGAWAVVAQQAAGTLLGAAALLARAGWRPRLLCRARDVRELLAIGAPLVAGTLVQHGRYRLFALVIGDVAGPAALGEIHLAFRLVDTVRELTTTALWRLMLPRFAERQHDRAALCGTLDRFLGLSGLVMFPLWGALALCAGPLIALLLGPLWSAASGATLPLVGLACWMSLGFPAGVAAVARGATGYTLIANLAMTALTLAGAVLLRPATPLAAALLWAGAQIALAPYVLAMGARALRLSPWRLLRAGLPSLALAALATGMAALASQPPAAPGTPIPTMLLRLAVLAAVFVPASALLRRADLREALHTVGLVPRPA